MIEAPASIAEHEPDYKPGAWESYTIAELGGIVAFFVKRAGMRADPKKAEKDLRDAQNYLDMMQAHIDAA